MLQNAYFLAEIGADTAENEQHFAETLPTDALWLGSKQRDRPVGREGRGDRTGHVPGLGVRNPVQMQLRDINRISNLVRIWTLHGYQIFDIIVPEY